MSSKISVIEGIRQKAKREVEFQLHAFETKSRYRGHDVETVKHVRRTKVHRMSADDEKELRKQVAHERAHRMHKQRLLNGIKRHQQLAEERFPEYSMDQFADSASSKRSSEKKKLQNRALAKLHRQVDLEHAMKVLPHYNGDLFGTHRSYLAGVMYMSRMTAAKKHKSHNPWDNGNENGGYDTAEDKKVIEFLENKQNVAKSLCNLSWHKSNSRKLVHEGGLKVLVEMSDLDDFSIRLSCAIALHNLSRDPDVQADLFENYVVETIARLSQTTGESAQLLLAHCIGALCALSAVQGYEAQMVREGALKAIDVALESPQTLEVQKLLTSCLLNLTTCFDEATSYPGWERVINSCRSAISSYLVDTRAKHHVASALSNLALYENHRARMISEGMVKDLTEFYEMFDSNNSVSSAVFSDAEAAIASTMNYLASCHGELKSAVVRQNGVQLLVRISRSKNNLTRQRCIMALNSLAMDTHGEGRAAGQVIGPIVQLSDSRNPTTRFRCTAAFRSMSSRQGSRKQMMKSNVVSVLLRMINTEINLSEDVWSASICNCTITLCNLLISVDTRARAIEGKAFDSVIMLLQRQQKLQEQQICCDAILTLTNTAEVAGEMRKAKTLGVIVRLLASPDPGIIKSVVLILKALCKDKKTCTTFCALRPDSLPYLVNLLTTPDEEIVLNVLIVISMAIGTTSMRKRMVQAGVESIVYLCGGANKEIQIWCAAILCALSFTPECRVPIIQAGAAKGLSIVSGIKEDVNQHRCSIAICNLSAEFECRLRMIEDGVTTSLISLSSAHHESIRFNCCKALCNLSCTVGNEMDLVQAGTLPELMLTALVRSEYPITKLVCIKTIANLIADDTIDILLEQGIAWAMMAATTASFAETDDEPLEDGLQIAGNVYCVVAKYDVGIEKLIDEPGVLRSLAVLMQSESTDTRGYAWKVLKLACQHPCQSRLMQENFLQTLKNMNVTSSLHIAKNIAALLSFLFRDNKIRRKISIDGIGVMQKIYSMDDDDTTLQCSEALTRLSCDDVTTKAVVENDVLKMYLTLAQRKAVETRSLVIQSLLHLSFNEKYIGSLTKQNALGVVKSLVQFEDSDLEKHSFLLGILRSFVLGDQRALVKGYGVIDVSNIEVTEENSLHHNLARSGIIKTASKIWSRLDKTNYGYYIPKVIQRDIAVVLSKTIYHVRNQYASMLNGGLLPILLFLTLHGDDFSSRQAVVALANLSHDGSIRQRLIDNEVVETLVELLKTIKTDNGIQRDCVTAFCNLSYCLERGKFLVDCGVYDMSVTMGNQSDEYIRSCCGKILTNLSVHADNTHDGSVAALLELCMPGMSTPSRDKKAEIRRSTTQAHLVKSQRTLEDYSEPEGTWADAHEYFSSNCKFKTKVEATLEINFANDGSEEEVDTSWVKEDAGSASGPPPSYPPTKDDEEKVANELRSELVSRKQVLASLIEEDIGNSTDEGANLDIVKFDKVQPTLSQLWYDPITAFEKVGRTFEGDNDNEEDFDYDKESDTFEEDETENVDKSLGNQKKAASSGHSTRPTTSAHDSRDSSRRSGGSRQRSNNSSDKAQKNDASGGFKEQEDGEVDFEEAIASDYGSRQSRRSVEELMTLNKESAQKNRGGVSFASEGSAVLEESEATATPATRGDQSNVSLLEAEGRPTSTPSLHFVDNALSAGLWNETPKIKWDKSEEGGKKRGGPAHRRKK
jgi:hypothetical protein